MGIALHLDEPAVDVARRLASMEIAYLPFPDGACDTRGSLHAVMRNGAVLVTKHAERTSARIKAASVHAASVGEARARIEMLFGDETLREAMRCAARTVPPGWGDIAEAHLAGYTLAMRGQRTGIDAGMTKRAGSLNDA